MRRFIHAWTRPLLIDVGDHLAAAVGHDRPHHLGVWIIKPPCQQRLLALVAAAGRTQRRDFRVVLS